MKWAHSRRRRTRATLPPPLPPLIFGVLLCVCVFMLCSIWRAGCCKLSPYFISANESIPFKTPFKIYTYNPFIHPSTDSFSSSSLFLLLFVLSFLNLSLLFLFFLPALILPALGYRSFLIFSGKSLVVCDVTRTCQAYLLTPPGSLHNLHDAVAVHFTANKSLVAALPPVVIKRSISLVHGSNAYFH